jgi:SAM-dependent methyltransferase
VSVLAATASSCTVCDAAAHQPILDLPSVPVFCCVLWPTREAALAAPRGDIKLGFCTACGMIRNVTFHPELVEYNPSYENSLHFSPTFQRFARDLADRLIERYQLRGKDIVDIGCGKGEFLDLICDPATGNRGVGFDPSYVGPPSRGNVSFVREYFSEAHAHTPADLICCRHVLEHLTSPRDLLTTLRNTSESHPGATLYFEVPDGGYMLRELDIWNVIYEHPSYFTAPAMRRLFEDAGFATKDLGSSFGGQYLYIESGRDSAANGSGTAAAGDAALEQLHELAIAFGDAFARKVQSWADRLGDLLARGRRVALWGAGARGVTFLNVVPGGERVELVVDLNVRKHGRFVAGTAQQVHGPEAVRELAPDVVLAMNPLYVDEIRRSLSESGVPAEVLAV